MTALPVLNGAAVRNRPSERPRGHGPGMAVNGAARRAIEEGLRGVMVEGGEVRFSEHDRGLYATDASLYQVQPIGVVTPASVEEAARVTAWCGRNGVPLLPRGGGTSLAGQSTNHAVVMDLTARCRALKGVDAAGRTCEVEPGIGIDELNGELARRGAGRGMGLFFAPDPATTRQAAIGGCIGNNAAGARSIRYGRTSENLAGVEVALTTGERLWLEAGAGGRDAGALRLARGVIDIVRAHGGLIRERYPKTVRRNGGYGLDMVLAQLDAGATAESLDLSPLLCGSEGTLAVTLTARLKLHELPKAKGLAVVSLPSVERAIEVVPALLEASPTAVELLDDVVLEAARGNRECRGYVEMLPSAAGFVTGAVLYVEFFGFGEGAAGEVAAGFDRVRGVLAGDLAAGRAAMSTVTEAGAMLKAWALRKAGEPLLHGLPGARKPITFVEDNAVPVTRLGEFVRGFKGIVAKHGTKAAYWAHASVGVLHVRPMIDLHDAADRARMVAIAEEVADLAKSCGGIMSGEHGDGRVRGPLLERHFGRELLGAFGRVKGVFDPAGVLNPGNIVAPGPAASIAADLRIDAMGAAGPAVEEIETVFDFSDQHGFLGAAEQCNGAGVCRKRSGDGGGTMCPSYMATLDERHSTRGRGNALRLAISGQFAGPAGGEGDWRGRFNDVETLATLDLCLSCKACKSECPSNVDISRLKAEYLFQGFARTGWTRKKAQAWVFGHVRVLNRLGSLTPGMANWVNRLGVAKWARRRLLELEPRRSLPPFARSLYAWKRERERRSGTGTDSRPRVVLFADCFTAYNEPRIGASAVRVLEGLGYGVKLLPGEGALRSIGWDVGEFGGGCCGRAMISTGLLKDAITMIDRTIGALRASVEDPGVAAVLVCEPSCLSAMKDDWLQLKTRTPLEVKRRLAAKAMLVEEFVGARWEEHPARAVVRRGGEGAVYLHGHCHQKALWGIESSGAVLRRLLGERLKVLNTGCCGMAGSFGFTSGRYGLSMAIGELGLLPAARAAGPGDVVCAPGTSCRHQVHDGAGRAAVHPIEVIEGMLEIG